MALLGLSLGAGEEDEGGMEIRHRYVMRMGRHDIDGAQEFLDQEKAFVCGNGSGIGIFHRHGDFGGRLCVQPKTQTRESGYRSCFLVTF